jgi:hypothetical protein
MKTDDSMSSDDVEGMREAMAEFDIFGCGYADTFEPYVMMAGDVVGWSRVKGWCEGLLTVLK